MRCQPVPITAWAKYKAGIHTIIMAKTPCERQQGLQGAKSLEEDTLVLFFNVAPGSYFHTRNCLFPIDIVAMGADSKILAIWTVTTGLDLIGPMPKGTNKVLEANAGWFGKHKLKVGDLIPFIRA